MTKKFSLSTLIQVIIFILSFSYLQISHSVTTAKLEAKIIEQDLKILYLDREISRIHQQIYGIQ